MCYLCSFVVLGCSACQKNQRFSWLTGIRPIIDKENSFLPASSHKLFSLSMALLIAYAHYIMKQSFMIVIYTRFAQQSLLYHEFQCWYIFETISTPSLVESIPASRFSLLLKVVFTASCGSSPLYSSPLM